MIKLSIIIPVRNEQDNIEALSVEITEVMDSLGCEWECLWIDDASEDRTPELLCKINKRNPRHKYYSHDICYGQSAALVTGFRNSNSEILVTLDGDGQNVPEDIPLLLDLFLKDDLDMVCGWRKNRSDNFVKKVSSAIANSFRNIITGDKIRDVGCSIRVFKKECISSIPYFKGMHRFIPTLARISGYEKIMELPVKHRPRLFGKSNYGIHNRLWVGILDTFAVLWMKKRLVNPKIKKE